MESRNRNKYSSLNNFTDFPHPITYQSIRSSEFTHWIAYATLIMCIIFNAGLAAINSNVIPLNSTVVIISEIFIDSLAAVLAFRARAVAKKAWIAFTLIIACMSLLTYISSSNIDPKFLRDILIIPLFTLFGFGINRSLLIKIVIHIQIAVLALMIYEAVYPEGFGKFFGVMSYYINTRGFEQSQFWSADTSELFASAARPNERFMFNFLNIHRLSSVFLEPVSLGNYCVIVAIICVSLWYELAKSTKVLLIISTTIVLIGCDGRFAAVAILFIIAIRVSIAYIPLYLNILYAPLIILGGVAFSYGLSVSSVGDDFASRTAGGTYAIFDMTINDLLGHNPEKAYNHMDTGIAYLLYSQSIFLAVALWVIYSLSAPQKDPCAKIYSHCLSVYLPLNLLISYSPLSIKTAALLWAGFGSMHNCAKISTISIRGNNSEDAIHEDGYQ